MSKASKRKKELLGCSGRHVWVARVFRGWKGEYLLSHTEVYPNGVFLASPDVFCARCFISADQRDDDD